jgi:peptidyl-tRNA hydrolase, PTH1 family
VIRLLVGLGNPGRRYRSTRHNVGFLVIDEIARRHGGPEERETAHSAVARIDEGGTEVVLARPMLLMNRSGIAVRALLEREGAEPHEMVVICDDFHLPFGSLRLRKQGSHGGHNGLRSIIDALGTPQFPRLRIGIGEAPSGEDQADYVLSGFPASERAALPEVVGAAADCAKMCVGEGGLLQAMNVFNRKPEPDALGLDSKES